MEIILQGHKLYNIKDWNGSVEISPLNLVQMKRISGARNTLSLFRKFVKILKQSDSPIELPETLSPENLDIGDFTQLLIGICAVSKGRQVQKTYKCPKCQHPNPRVFDIINIFKPQKPVSDKSPELIFKVKNQDVNVTITNVTVQDFLSINTLVEEIELFNIKTRLQDVRNKYGEIFNFEDDEDIEDFKDLLLEVGITALKITIPSLETFNDKLKWLFKLQGNSEITSVYTKISKSIIDLSPSVTGEYKTKCDKCKTKITDNLEATDYFFDLRWISLGQ